MHKQNVREKNAYNRSALHILHGFITDDPFLKGVVVMLMQDARMYNKMVLAMEKA
ncbi:hypothetical protein HNQ69_001696 [Bartonella callosciuri]|uniref:Uncharacterized protein n=1 Tax=Bartonella callosciuri TaxID=686223 RepID=A0A840NSR5_9HYPH|nr:hypothetical protein [Bartonella callosciuri]MBB5074544.1 hypothetical protein [Bartonella callosciuri]